MSLSSSLFIFTTFKIFRFFRSAKKTEYSGMTIQVGNPSFLYEEMLDYEDNNVHPEVDNGQEKVTWWGGGIWLNILTLREKRRGLCILNRKFHL